LSDSSTKPWRWHFAALAATWGCSFWWIHVSLTWLQPIGVAFMRLLLGALTLLVITRRAGIPIIRDPRTIAHVTVVSLTLSSLPFALFSYGQREVSSILAAIINATTPLSAMVIGFLVMPSERPVRRQLLGLAIGFLGVMVVLGIWDSVPSSTVRGVVLCVLAITCYGVSYPYARRHISVLGLPPTSLAVTQTLVGTALLLPVVAVMGIRDDVPGTGPDVGALVALLALGAMSTGVAYILNYTVIERAGATVASSVTYVTPAVAVVVGSLFLGESVSWNNFVGTAIILTGVYLTRPPATRGAGTESSPSRA